MPNEPIVDPLAPLADVGDWLGYPQLISVLFSFLSTTPRRSWI
jgi:hypothetical protein